MKIRNSYVSNSSSSSYVIGIALIKDEFIEKIREFIKNSEYGYFEIVEGQDKKISVESFNYDSVDIFVKKGKFVLMFNETIDAITNDYGEIVSQAELEDFYDCKKIFNELSDCFSEINYSIGSGYNG